MEHLERATPNKGYDDPGDDVPSYLPRYDRDHHQSIPPQKQGTLAGFTINIGPSDESSVDFSTLSLPSTAENSTASPMNVTHVEDEGRPSLPVRVFETHVVDEERPPIPARDFETNPSPLEESQPTETQRLKALLKSRKCRIISALALVLIIGVIVARMLLTKNGPTAATTSPTKAPIDVNNSQTQARSDVDEIFTTRDEFRTELQFLLSNESLTALDNSDSPQNQSLQWLLETSNFQEMPLRRLIQRYAWATIYYAADGGPSWYNAGGDWLTNVTECTWVQGSGEGDACDDLDTLHTLNLKNMSLTGTIPDEIGLLHSLTDIDLSQNQNSGSLPSELISLTALTSLLLHNNEFTGTVASELGTMSALKSLNLDTNKLSGTVPSELGSLTALTELRLGTNFFNGTVPSELGSLTALNFMILGSNNFNGPVPSELGSLTALTGLLLGWNQFTGTVPSEFVSLTALETLVITATSLNGTVLEELCILGTVTIYVNCNPDPDPQCSCCGCY